MSVDLEVLLQGARVGRIAPDDKGRLAFRFDSTWLQRHPRPVLGQTFEDAPNRAYVGKGGDLPPFFLNLLPERSGALRPFLASTFSISSDDDVALLKALGADLPGAVTVRDAERAPASLERSVLDDAVGPTKTAQEDGESLRFSLGGVQLKFSVLLADARLTLPTHGKQGDWLVKCDAKDYPALCKNEYATMRWAARAGFEVPELRLLPIDELPQRLRERTTGSYALAVRRFDRTPQGRIHQEDFAQVVNFEPRLKYDHVTYEKLTRLVLNIIDSDAALELVRRLVLMIATGNGDAHLKNWSLLYTEPTRPRLAPLYDQVATIAYPEVSRELALKFSGVKRFSELDAGVFQRLAPKAELAEDAVMRAVNETLDRLADAWEAMRGTDDDAWPSEHRTALLQHFKKTPLLANGPLGRLLH